MSLPLFSLPSPHLNEPRATEQHKVLLEKQSPDVPRVSQSLSLFFLLSCPLLPSLAFPTLLCRVCEEHCRRALVEWVVTG